MKINKTIKAIYLLIIGITIGASLYAGAVVAPVTFHSEKWLGSELLSRFQEGLIMTHNFIGLGYFILVSMIAIFLYEGYKYKSFNRDPYTIIASLGAIMSGALFKFFYMDSIINMQKQGQSVVNSKIFENMHKGSEIALVLFMIFLITIFIRDVQRD